MDIHAGGQVITDVQVFSERVWHLGTSRPSMRVQLTGALSEAQLEALQTQPWELYEGDELMGRHTGYTTLITHELRLAAVTDAEVELNQAQTQLQTAQAQVQQLTQQLDGDIAQLKQQDQQLERRLDAAAQSTEFLEGCIMELASVVYA